MELQGNNQRILWVYNRLEIGQRRGIIEMEICGKDHLFLFFNKPESALAKSALSNWSGAIA
jgi:hypothetical protein